MKRKLLFLERVMYGNGEAPFNGVFHLQLKGSFTVESMRFALNKVQCKHPMLRAAITHDARNRPWFISHEEAPEIPLHIQQRLHSDDWRTATVRGWKTIFNTATGPMIEMVWLRGDTLSDLLLVFHHSLCDGASAVAIMQEILQLLEDPDTDIGTSHMVGPLQQWLHPRIRQTWLLRLKGIAGGALATLFFKAGAVMAASKKHTVIPRHEDYLLHWKLSAEESRSILQYCKAQDVTVNTALSLAWMRAFHAVQQQHQFKITCPVDIRKFIDEIKNDTVFSFGVSISFSFDKDTRTPFWQKARALQQTATRQLRHIQAYELLFSLEHYHGIIPPMQKMFRSGSIKPDFMFSNMGPVNIRQQYRSFEVTAVNSPTVIGPFGNPTTIITTTYKGQMDFGFVSNNTIIPETAAQAIRDKAMALLLADIPAALVSAPAPVLNVAL